MGESQSRYSIVERLTQAKIEIMSLKYDLNEELIKKQQKTDELKSELSNWDNDMQEDLKRERREFFHCRDFRG